VPRYLLDTNTVAFLIRESSPRLVARLRKVRAAQVALSVVTEMEIRCGLAKNPALRAAPKIEEFLGAMTVHPLTSEVAAVYGRVRAGLDAKGTPIGPLDLMIASHALTLGATLVTSNLREFQRVPRLRCQDWTR